MFPSMSSVAALCVVALALTACNDGDNDADAQATVTVTASPDETPGVFESEAEQSDSSSSGSDVEPNLGDDALRVGQPRKGSLITTTLREVRIPMPPAEYREPAAGKVYLGLKLKQCLSKDASAASEEEIYSSYTGEFAAVTPGGDEYAGGNSSWNDWPEPKFPETVTLVPGRCVQGWMAFEVPAKIKIASILWRPGGTTVAEWLPN